MSSRDKTVSALEARSRSIGEITGPRHVAQPAQHPQPPPLNFTMINEDSDIDWDEELLYAAYYQGGLRVLDVSGELLGDLYRQGREVASFFSDDPEADMPNSTMAWGPQPHKGTIFFTDHYSGLWAVKLKEKEPAEGEVEEEEGK